MPWSIYEADKALTEFYEQCDQSMREAIDQRLTLLRMKGNSAKMPISLPLGSGLFELRVKAKRRHARFIYYFRKGQVIVILVATFKDQRKLARSIIVRAKNIRGEIESQSGSHNVSALTH